MVDNFKDKRQSCDLFSSIKNFYLCAATTYFFFLVNIKSFSFSFNIPLNPSQTKGFAPIYVK